jgi:hypothetical protein
MMLTEARTEQRRDALRNANKVRVERAEVKRQLVDGELSFEALLSDPPTAVLNVPIGVVLEWAPGIGRWRSNRILASERGGPIVGRMVHLENISEATKARILARYERWVPLRYSPCG